jgi:hypothetical protein
VQSEKQKQKQANYTSKKGRNTSITNEKSTPNKGPLNTNLEIYKKKFDDIKIKKPVQRDSGSQTAEVKLGLTNETTQTDNFLDSAKTNDKPADDYNEKYEKSNVKYPRNGNTLSREEMLKLLEQVQINTPLESQNTTRIKQSDSTLLSTRSRKQVSKLETLLFGDSGF